MSGRSAAFRGFTLVELMVVLVVIGILAAIAIPNLIQALEKGRHKRTMGDMRSIATAIEQYNMDAEHYPQLDDGGTLDEVRSSLEPTYIKQLPTLDGWKNTLNYSTEDAGQTYELISYGRDRLPGGPAGDPPTGPTTSFDDDIIYATGMFRNVDQ